jgi:hypothetical protein
MIRLAMIALAVQDREIGSNIAMRWVARTPLRSDDCSQSYGLSGKQVRSSQIERAAIELAVTGH